MEHQTFPLWVRRFALPVTIFLLVLGVPYLLRPVARVLLAVFAGILLAIFLDGGASLLRRLVPMPRWLALSLVILLIVLAGAGLFWIGGALVADQAAGLMERLPEAVARVRSYIQRSGWMDRLLSLLPQGGGAGGILDNLTSVFSSTLEVFAHLVIILFTGFYVAINPAVYTRALLRLVPLGKRPRGEEVLAELGQVMRYWLVGRLTDMAVVGILTGVGLAIVGAPLPLILGVIAGLLSFIPFLGPIFSAVPAILVAFTAGLGIALKVVLVFVAVQFVEGNLITPFIERRAVMIPPAFVVAGQFLMAVLLGFYGVLLATPLIVLATILVQMLYIEDVLGEPVKILGER